MEGRGGMERRGEEKEREGGGEGKEREGGEKKGREGRKEGRERREGGMEGRRRDGRGKDVPLQTPKHSRAPMHPTPAVYLTTRTHPCYQRIDHEVRVQGESPVPSHLFAIRLVVVKSVFAMMDSFGSSVMATGVAAAAMELLLATGCCQTPHLPGYSIVPDTRGCKELKCC